MSELAIRRKAESHIRDYGADVWAALVAGPFEERRLVNTCCHWSNLLARYSLAGIGRTLREAVKPTAAFSQRTLVSSGVH